MRGQVCGALCNGVHGEGARAFEPKLISGTLEQFKKGIAIAGRAVCDDAREAFDLAAILAAVRSIGAGDDDQPLPIHAEAIVGIVIDAAAHAVAFTRFGKK